MQTADLTDDLIPAEELIPVSEFCAGHQVELTFISTLHRSGLIQLTMVEGAAFFPAAGLHELEKFVRWHYELDINVEGMEALYHMLSRLDHMQGELMRLRNRLRFYESEAK